MRTSIAAIALCLFAGPLIGGAQPAERVYRIFIVSADPVTSGLVSSLARPGGNSTGVVYGLYDDKLLEMLKLAIPGIVRVACICYASPRPDDWSEQKISAAARILGLEVVPIAVRSPDDFERFFSAARNAGAQAALIPDIARFGHHQARLGKLSAQARLPAISITGAFADAPEIFRPWP